MSRRSPSPPRPLPLSGREAWALFALLALWLQALIPLGFMPGRAADGSTTLVLCSGVGSRTATVDADGQELPADEAGATAGQVCAFALTAAPLLPPAPPVLVARSLLISADAAPLPSPRVLLPAPRGPPLPARGPPAHA